MASTNPSHSHTEQQQSAWYIILRLTFDTSQVVTRFQLTMHDGVHITLEQIPDSDSDLIPLNARLNETWARRDYELILEPYTHLIPRRTWLNESWTQRQHEIPEHVQNQVDEFFGQLPPSTYSARYPVFWYQNILVGQSASNNSEPISDNQTLQMLPMNAPNEEAGNSTYESQIQMGAATASPSINANADPDEEIDLELRLGRSQ